MPTHANTARDERLSNLRACSVSPRLAVQLLETLEERSGLRLEVTPQPPPPAATPPSCSLAAHRDTRRTIGAPRQ